ncbi:hypothetical protein [Glycomyces harbinensis]|uniref:hypothetical protein n=1 Tax=Glycomyces harbinensis TaxID=58114 RepID=UPI0015A6D25E|nr:hypothetical protein [Glycomyces harbinensis]
MALSGGDTLVRRAARIGADLKSVDVASDDGRAAAHRYRQVGVKQNGCEASAGQCP